MGPPGAPGVIKIPPGGAQELNKNPPGAPGAPGLKIHPKGTSEAIKSPRFRSRPPKSQKIKKILNLSLRTSKVTKISILTSKNHLKIMISTSQNLEKSIANCLLFALKKKQEIKKWIANCLLLQTSLFYNVWYHAFSLLAFCNLKK